MQNDIDKKVSEFIANRLNIEFLPDIRKESEGYKIYLRPKLISAEESFTVSVLIGWKRLNLGFTLGDKAGLLVNEMSHTDEENKDIFCAIADNVLTNNGSVELTINGLTFNVDSHKNWPVKWQNIKINLRTPIIDSDGDLALNENLSDYINKWVYIFLSMLIPLLPLVEHETSIVDNFDGLPEGAQKMVIVNRYERSTANRQACIAILGTKCKICGFDFGDQFGGVGIGFIEVHHIIPVSQIGENYKINPIRDLIPICSNCHSMVHRKNPPYTIDEVKSFIKLK